MSQNIIEVINLNKSYGKKQVLKDVSLSVKSNEIVGFIGPNGAGKSTTLKCLCNLIYPDSGSITINGYNLLKDRENALKHQAALIEAPGLYADMTGRENIKLIGMLRNISKERMQEIYEFTNIKDALNRKVSGYSMGMKQRLALGICIMSKPKFLILDEPSNGLDPTGIIDLRNTLEHLRANEDMSILFSSHQLGEVEKLADRIICINDGRIIEPPTAFNNRFSYMIQVSNQQRAKIVVGGIIGDEKVQLIGEDALRVDMDHLRLDEMIVALKKADVVIHDIEKNTLDVESIYEEVYGAGVS